MSAPFVAGVVGAGAVPLAVAAAAVRGDGPALVVVRGAPAPASGPAGARARGLTARLAAAGVPAVAGGRAAWLALGVQDDAQAGLLAARLAAPAPVLLAVEGVRDATGEELLAACAAILVAGDAGDPVVALAAASLQRDGVPAGLVRPPGAAEALALRMGAPPGAARRRALAQALAAGAGGRAVPGGRG
ncbi:MAG: hypothetical protein MUC84_05360 [Solirubrobacteraceae bacterium]|nr:hypothetical protein [Solirubrobacteraceae bacterium]